MKLEQYERTLDQWAEEERRHAAEAKQAGDERMHSISLMKASMLGNMLRVLGKTEMARGGVLLKLAEQNDREAERLKEIEDFDAAERSEIKAQTIRRALRLIENGDE